MRSELGLCIMCTGDYEQNDAGTEEFGKKSKTMRLCMGAGRIVQVIAVEAAMGSSADCASITRLDSATSVQIRQKPRRT